MHVAPDFAYSKQLAWFDYRLLVYMDDILVVSYMHDHARTRKLLVLLAELFELFGITINPEKSLLEPAQEVEYLGMLLHTMARCALLLNTLPKFVPLPSPCFVWRLLIAGSYPCGPCALLLAS